MVKYILLLLIAVSTIQLVHAQNFDDSIAGDREALEALYKATNGDQWINNTGWLEGNPSNSWHGITVNSEGRVTKVELQENNLTGELPHGVLGNLKQCTVFRVKINYLTGTLPADIGYMENLEHLYISGKRGDPNPADPKGHIGYEDYERNDFTGALPPEWGNLSKLKLLEISRLKNLDTTLPPEWSGMVSLEGFQAYASRVTGPLPESWSTWKNLVAFGLTHSPVSVSGLYPTSWSEWDKIKYFSVSGSFEGTIPEEWASWGNTIVHFSTAGGNINGSLPSLLASGGFSKLNIFHFQRNNVTSLPDISAMGNALLYAFNLKNNNIVGTFPSELLTTRFVNSQGQEEFGFRRLTLLYLDSNKFFGELPDYGWDKFPIIRRIDLGNNNFEGPLPVTMGDITTNVSTFVLRLQNNKFSGSVPENWVNISANGWSEFMISGNELHGPLPIGLTFPASVFHIQDNKFTYSDIIPLLNNFSTLPNNLQYGSQKPFPVNDYEVQTKIIPVGSSATLNLSGIDITGNTYQWRKDGQILANGEHISGATSHTLVISNIEESDQGEYTLRITNPNAPQLAESLSEPITVRIGEPSDELEAPGLLLPKSNPDVASNSMELQWTQVQGATLYRLQLSTDQNFTAGSTTSFSNISETSFFVNNLLYDTGYFYRIMAYNERQQSPWSATGEFTTGSNEAIYELNAPDLKDPGYNPKEEPRVIYLNWSVVEGASRYRLEHATEQTFAADSTLTFEDIADTSIVLENLEYETGYYYRVMAYNATQQSKWSATGAYTTAAADTGIGEVLAAPELLPADYNPDDEPEVIHLNWTPVEQAAEYPVEISTEETFPAGSTTMFEQNPDTSLFIDSLDYETTYYYRVKARNGNAQSPWSQTAQFRTAPQPVYTLSAPGILTPELNVDGKANSVILNWETAIGAVTYDLQIATKEQFQLRFTTDISGVEATSLLLDNLNFVTTYYYRVRSVDGPQHSAWSDIALITTSNDPSDQLSSPGTVKEKGNSGKGNKNIVEAEWEEVQLAEDYQLQLSTDQNFSAEETMTILEIKGTTHTIDDLDYESIYYYRVRARKGRAFSPWSDVTSAFTGTDEDKSGIDPATGVPVDYQLAQNYPNPFNPTTQIRYSIPEASYVTIDILNIQGQHVRRLVNSDRDAGVHTVTFNAATLSSGIYLYVITAGSYSDVKKMTLIK